MGLNDLPNNSEVADGEIIDPNHILDITAALEGELVGHNTSGGATSGQSLGTALYPWGPVYCGSLIVNGSAIDVSEVSVPPTRIISGATSANSGQPMFLQADGAAANVKILATTTDLTLSINSTTITISADITETGLTTAPNSNNTCQINDANFTDQAESKYFGEIDSLIPYITIDTVGSEISALVGQWVSLKTDTNEIMFGFLKSATELVNVYRGFFFDDSLDPIVRETLIDNEVLTLLKTGYVFVDDDGTTVDVTYTSPVYQYDAPTSPVAGDYWYDITNTTWKRYSGSAWVAVDRIPLGICVMNTSYCIATRPFDFYCGGDLEENTLDCEVFSDTIVKTSNQTNRVNVYGTALRFEATAITWDNTADMETGSVGNDTDYYLYLSTLGDRKISTERPYDRTDLRGKYHPYENWRYICKAKTDGSADWLRVIESATFDGQPGLAKFDADGLLFDATGNDTVYVKFDRLTLTNAAGKTKTLYDFERTITFSDYLQGAELASTWYDWWIDSRGKFIFVPRLEGTTDGTTSGYLVDSGNAFASYSVFKRAIAYNTTDLTQTTVSISATSDTADLAVTDDYFATGEGYMLQLLDPVGLDSFAVYIGSVYNNSSSNLDDSFYAQIQEEKYYSEAAGDFTVTGTLSGFSIVRAVICVRQFINRLGVGLWKTEINIAATVSSQTAAGEVVTISGVTFKDYGNSSGVRGQAISATDSNGGNDIALMRADSGAATLEVIHSSDNVTGYAYTANVEVDKKPAFHT
jgi:hypothetical protein